jgi:hypothetical protein
MEKKKLACQGIPGRKKWAKPKLIILTKGKPDEMALAACKGAVAGCFPNADEGNCIAHEGGAGSSCTSCSLGCPS